MTLVTGAWAPNSTSNQRMRLELDYSISSTATTSTVTGTVYVAAGYSFVDVNNSFSYSGSLLGSGSANNRNINVPTGGRQAIYTFTKTVTRTSAAQGMTVAFSLSGIEYVGATASVSATVTIPGTGSTTPPPTGSLVVTISRSGGSIKVEFTGGHVQKIEARRREVRGDSSSKWMGWELVGTSSGYASGTSFPALVGYDWQVAVTRTTPTASGAVSNVLRHYSAAPALTSATVTRSSDARHNTGWAVTASAEQPITGFEIQRWTLSEGRFVGAVNGLSASARAWTDTASIYNDRARWAIRALNSVGAGPWSYTPYVRGTPAAPTRPTVARSGATDVVLTARNQARAAQTFDVWGQSYDGAAWSTLAPLAGHTGIPAPAYDATWTRTLAGLDPARQWRLAVAAVVNEPAELSARSLTSLSLQLLAPPNAPTPTPPGVVSSATAPTFAWRHNPADGSEQTAAEFEYRPHGTTTWTTLTATTAQQVSLPAPLTPGNYYLRVRTKGAHADFSPWSSMLAFTVAQPPVVTIVSPDQNATIATNRLSVDIAYSDPFASMVRWTRRLHSQDGLIEEATGTGAPSRITFTTVLDDQSEYWAEVSATSGTGLQSNVARVDVSTSFKPPFPPHLGAAWDQVSGVVRLALTHVTPTPAIPGLAIPGSALPGTGLEDVDYDEAVSGRVERSIDAGLTWEVVADDLAQFAEVEDWLVPLNIPALYRAVATTALGVEGASVPLEVVTSSQDVWLRGRDGVVARVQLDLELEPRYGHASISEDYGREKPVAHFGRQRPVEVGVSGELVAGYGLERDWTVFLGQHVWYRDPTGNAFWARITEQGFGLPQRWSRIRAINFLVEEVEPPRGVTHA